MVDERGQESGGCCLSVSLRDYGRMGLFMLGGGMAGGQNRCVPDGWIAAATRKQADVGDPRPRLRLPVVDRRTTGASTRYGIFRPGHPHRSRSVRLVIVGLQRLAPRHRSTSCRIARANLFAAVATAVDAEAQKARP